MNTKEEIVRASVRLAEDVLNELKHVEKRCEAQEKLIQLQAKMILAQEQQIRALSALLLLV